MDPSDVEFFFSSLLCLYRVTIKSWTLQELSTQTDSHDQCHQAVATLPDQQVSPTGLCHSWGHFFISIITGLPVSRSLCDITTDFTRTGLVCFHRFAMSYFRHYFRPPASSGHTVCDGRVEAVSQHELRWLFETLWPVIITIIFVVVSISSSSRIRIMRFCNFLFFNLLCRDDSQVSQSPLHASHVALPT
jgi:hypothetical protein